MALRIGNKEQEERCGFCGAVFRLTLEEAQQFLDSLGQKAGRLTPEDVQSGVASIVHVCRKKPRILRLAEPDDERLASYCSSTDQDDKSPAQQREQEERCDRQQLPGPVTGFKIQPLAKSPPKDHNVFQEAIVTTEE